MNENTLTPTLTDAGLAAVVNGQATGLAAEITHVALGEVGYQPDRGATALRGERQRVAVAGGERTDARRIHLTALADGDLEYKIREVGFFLADGTLLALYSRSGSTLVTKTAGVDLLLAFDLAIEALPAESVEIRSGEGDLSLFYATDFAALVAAQANAARREMRLRDTVRELTDHLETTRGELTVLRRWVEERFRTSERTTS